MAAVQQPPRLLVASSVSTQQQPESPALSGVCAQQQPVELARCGTARLSITLFKNAQQISKLCALVPLHVHRRMPTDVEFMWFRASRAGPATFQVLVQPNYPNTVTGRSNLNLQLRIFDQSGAQLTAAMGVGIGRFDYTLPAAGIYYTSVAGVGSGADASTGYTSYGSRGVYQLVVTYPSDGNMSLPTQTPSTPVSVY